MLKRVNRLFLKLCMAIKYKVGKNLDNKLGNNLSELEDNERYLYKNLENNEKSSKDDYLLENSKNENSNTKVTDSNIFNNKAKKTCLKYSKEKF